jgi:acyl-coenzyme A synthetase/AMP-(fatty) acid ligase
MSVTTPVVSFADQVFHHALTRPAKAAIILSDRVATYDMMAQGILRVEARIRALALDPGALISVALGNPIRLMIVTAALFRLGHPVLSVATPETSIALNLPIAAFLHGPGLPFMPGRRQVIVDDPWFVGEPQPLSASPPRGFANDQAIACVALSSGTTGWPKAISLTIDAFQQWVMNYYSSIGYGTWERLLLLIGLTSSWGLTIAAHALFAGRTVMFANNPRETLHMIGVYGVDAMAATSVQLREIVREQTREPVPCTSLRIILTGGGLLSRSMFAEARARLCSNIINLYGSTEAGGTAFATIDRLTEVEGATGFVAPWAEVEIVDDKGNLLPAGNDGILRIRATCQGAPYPPGAANASFHGGWFYPGDIGRITAEGLMILSGRTSDVINVGGLKLAPEVVEEILRRHPAVAEAAAFGAMGESGIEEISVAVVASGEIADAQLIHWCAERGIPLTRIFRLEALPKSPSGKISRDQLKRQLLEMGDA